MKSMETARIRSKPDSARVLIVGIVAGTLFLCGPVPAQDHHETALPVPAADLAGFQEFELALFDPRTETFEAVPLAAVEGQASAEPGAMTSEVLVTGLRVSLMDDSIEILMSADLAGRHALVRATIAAYDGSADAGDGETPWGILFKIAKEAIKKVIKVLEAVVKVLEVLDAVSFDSPATPGLATCCTLLVDRALPIAA